MGFIARFFLVLAAPITALFVTEHATNFGVIQMIVAMMLFVAMAAVLAFWPRGATGSAPTE